MKLKEINEKKGITLIALVITILVLLILAGITIGTVASDNGILQNSVKAKERTEIAEEREIVDTATVQAMSKNNRGIIEKTKLETELDNLTGEGVTEVTEDTEEGGYFVKFIESGRIYKVDENGNVEYLGQEEELLTKAEITADPESDTTPKLTQEVDLTVKTIIDIGEVDYTLVYAWSKNQDTAPVDTEFKVADLKGEGRIRKATVYSDVSDEGNYYLWVRAVVGEIEQEERFGPYAIKDHTMLIATSAETQSISGFLGSKEKNENVVRGKIEKIEIITSKTGHSLDDDNCWDVSQSKDGTYMAWYEDKDNNGYYEITIGGEGGIIANTNSTYLFANIGAGITDSNIEVIITGLENLDTELAKNMDFMFNNCKASSLNLSNFNTSNVSSMWYMFKGCSNIEELDLSKFDTNKVTNMTYMFYDCTKLKNLNISSFNTINVSTMNAMFKNCNSLLTLDMSSFNTSNVTDMGSMFESCSKLINLDVNNFNTSKVTNMGTMFRGLKSITQLDLNNFDTSNVTNMDYMFYDCTKLVSLKIDNFNTSKLRNIGRTFWYCRSLKNLDVSSFDTSNITNMERTFANCSSLTSLELSNFDTSKVTSMAVMFGGCSNLTNLNLINFNTEKVTSMESMFSNCSNLTTLDISNFNTSNVKYMQGMFNDCKSLTKLNLENFDTSKVTSMESMFADCNKLTELDVSSFNTSNVTTMLRMFMNCNSITKLDLSNFNTSNLTNMETMFHGCSKLLVLDIRNFDTLNVTNLYSTFGYLPNNIEIIVNENTKKWIEEKFPELKNNITLVDEGGSDG